ncbi:MAG: glycosyltransferase [Promethearchaeota archaeon]|nr:MAG: glycosyltransferase [Candidatus Lokiarchaeota archaeon]
MVKQKLDIGFFTSMYSQTNGTAHACRFLSEAIAKLGHNVHVYAPRIENGYKKPANLHFHNFGGARVSSKTGFVLSFPLHKYFFCQEDYLDITHIHTHATFGSMAINWAKYLGIPMCGTHNSPLTFYAPSYMPILGKLLSKSDLIWRYEKHIIDKYDFVSVPTRSKKDQLLDHKFKEPIVCLTNGIPDIYFQDVKEGDIREKYNLGDKKVLLYASRIAPEKHPVQIAKIFKKIHKKVPDAHLLFVGSEGKETDKLIRTIKRHRMEDYVTLGGRVPFVDLLKLYKTADLTCLWSWIEAEGLVLIEAMAQGTPNVGANGYGIKDVIQHGKTGYLADNYKQFAKRVIELFKDDDLRAEMGKNAKEIAQYYKMSNVAKTWVDLYKFTINELYPLRYYDRARSERVELIKEYVYGMPTVNF